MIKLHKRTFKTPFRYLKAAFSETKERFNFSDIQNYIGKREVDGKTEFRYVNGELVPIGNLVLRQHENIEDYVLKIVKNYFRTTNRNGLTVESKLEDHGLDSLDAIELAMQIEEDLGYKISSENLSLFRKVRHYVNFIEQVENFKTTYQKDPLS